MMTRSSDFIQHLRRGWRDPLPQIPSPSRRPVTPHVRYSPPLEGGAQIDHMDVTEYGYNALMLAAQYDHQDVVRMLLDADADTGLLTSTDGEEENNWSNVMVAAWYGGEEVRLLRGVREEEHSRVTDRPTPQAHTLRCVPRPCTRRKRVSSSSAEWWAVGTHVARLRRRF